ncbi:hypothetical protein ACFFGV_11620 [Pontibacillus salicampi]|uniref:Histone deacetylase n=1 Tax=Pontibacillus salicampi TaxID=1449801 RepID=A0ABV6LP80_9BACI
MKHNSRLVWYASFGSNLFRDRFMCYITGGQPEGSNRSEVGCRDHTLPRETRAVSLPYGLYFSGYSDRWDGAAAYIDTTQDDENHSWARMYLITEEQFEDVVRQENGIEELEVNIDDIMEKGNVMVQDSPYGNLIYAGEEDGYPIFTFTSPKAMRDRETNQPSLRYLTMLVRGYMEAHTEDPVKITNYLMEKPGIKEHYSYHELLAFAEDLLSSASVSSE